MYVPACCWTWPPLSQYHAFPFFLSFLKDFYVFIFREEGRETSVYGCLSHALSLGPVPQPRHVP